jgi:hypothetical protein
MVEASTDLGVWTKDRGLYSIPPNSATPQTGLSLRLPPSHVCPGNAYHFLVVLGFNHLYSAHFFLSLSTRT